MLIDIVIIVLLIVLNGVLAMTELAVVSSRKNRLETKAEAGIRSARIALDLKDDPSKFLSTVQIGITLIGILSGAFSGVTLAGPLGAYFTETFPVLGQYADDLAMGLVVTLVTYLSLVIGELVPKQIALRYADNIAVAIARPITWLSRLTNPLVVLLDASNRCILALLGIKREEASTVSEEDVKAVIAEGTAAGVLEPEEKQMLDRVMRLDDLPLVAAMTHRKDTVWIDINEGPESILHKIEETHHSRYPLCQTSFEQILGIVVVKDVLLQLGRGKQLDLRAIAHTPMYMPKGKSVLEALEEFKRSTSNMALIVDEYGGLEGIVTLKDIMEVIVGVLPEPAHREDYTATLREDGSWLVDGGLSIHEAEEMIGMHDMMDQEDSFTTVAGFMFFQLGQVPKAGDHLDWREWRFEVMDMDGTRIDKLLVSKVTTEQGAITAPDS
ncbi:MAG: hemolysin family protein [Nitrospira sp.]